MEEKLHFNSTTIHGGQEPDKAYGAVMPPIYQTSTYAQSTPGGHKGSKHQAAIKGLNTAERTTLPAKPSKNLWLV